MCLLILSFSQHHHLFRSSHIPHLIPASEDFSALLDYDPLITERGIHTKNAPENLDPSLARQRRMKSEWAQWVREELEGWPLVSVCYVPCLGEGSQTHLIHCNLVTQAVILTPVVYGVRGMRLREPKQPARVETAKQKKGWNSNLRLSHCYGLNCVPQIHTLKPQHTNVFVFGDRAYRR